MIKFNKTLAAVAISLCSTVAFAGPTACPATGANADGLALSDVTYGMNLPGVAANACWGVVSGNDTAEAIDGFGWGNGWALLAKSDGADDISGLLGYDWDLTATAGKTGNYTLTASPLAGLPKVFDFVAVIKASDSYAAYFFDDKLFDGNSGGDWKVSYLNNGGKIPDLSHLSVYGRFVRDDEPPLPPQENPVPEPASLALVGLGLLAAASARRKAAA